VKRWITTLIAAVALASAGLVSIVPAEAATATNAMTKVAASAGGKSLSAGCRQAQRFTWTPVQYFWPGDCYQTPGAALVMQFDGSLWLYFSDGSACFTPTQGRFGAYAVFQTDGNLVIYAGDTAVWDSRTDGNYNARLILRGDGTLLIRNEAGAAIWVAC
jgi:hypothetical protein